MNRSDQLRNHVPERVFKFQTPETRAFTDLSERALWFGSPKTFNDPFDCAIDFIEDSIRDAFKDIDVTTCVKFIAQMNPGDEAMKLLQTESRPDEEIRYLAEKCLIDNLETAFGRGVCCFSQRIDNPLMWGHYASGHQGFCLEFLSSSTPFGNHNGLYQVEYADSFPLFDVKRVADGDFDYLLTFLLTKSTDWSYEQEWRLICTNPNQHYEYPATALKGIYFGAQMNAIHRFLLAKLFEKLFQPYGTQLFEMKLSRDNFSLQSEPVHLK